jgi:hypothetical protein
LEWSFEEVIGHEVISHWEEKTSDQ